MKRRRGYSLIEVLFVCTLTTVAIILGSQTLLLLYRTEANVRDDARLIQVISRLGREFRRDAHAARTAEVGADCRLQQPDGRIVIYATEREAIVRRVEQADQVVARESFALPRGAAGKFARQETNGRVTVGLELIAENETRPSNLGRGARPWQVKATLGLHALATKEGGP